MALKLTGGQVANATLPDFYRPLGVFAMRRFISFGPALVVLLGDGVVTPAAAPAAVRMDRVCANDGRCSAGAPRRWEKEDIAERISVQVRAIAEAVSPRRWYIATRQERAMAGGAAGSRVPGRGSGWSLRRGHSRHGTRTWCGALDRRAVPDGPGGRGGSSAAIRARTSRCWKVKTTDEPGALRCGGRRARCHTPGDARTRTGSPFWLRVPDEQGSVSGAGGPTAALRSSGEGGYYELHHPDRRGGQPR